MKIVLITSFFPPVHTAGTEKRTLGYALALQDMGHEVQVVCAGNWNEGERYWNGYIDEIYRQISVRRVQLNWVLAPDPNRFLYENPVVEKYLNQWLCKWQPDIVHITSCLTLSASIIQCIKNQGIPVVLTLTDFWFICPRLNLLREDKSLCNGKTTSEECLKCQLDNTKIYKGLDLILPEKAVGLFLGWVSKQPKLNKQRGLRGMALDMEARKFFLPKMLAAADMITAPSKCLRDIFEASGTMESIRVIHSGHDLSWLERLPQKKASDYLRIGYIGQIIPVKGVHILLKAFVAANFSDQATLAIYGDHNKSPDYTIYLEDLLIGNDVDVRFFGEFPHEKLGEILSKIDILVVPSQWHENNPRVIQESFASKTPVIASDVDGISEFVRHEVNGLLFKRGDVQDLARQLRRVVNDIELLDKLCTQMDPVKTIAEEMIEFEAIYRDLLRQRQSIDLSKSLRLDCLGG